MNAEASASGPESAPRPGFNALSYNIQGHGALFSRGYLTSIARAIRQASPDVVGLQEVHRGTWAARFRDQVEDLAVATGMTAHFGRSLTHRTGEYGNAVLTRGRVTEEEITPLPGEAERRSLFRCRIELSRQEIDFYVTHFAAWGPLTRGIRRRQADFVAGRLRESRDANMPFILVGDLNAHPGAAELGPLMSNGDLRVCGERNVPTHRVMRHRLDYILADPLLRPVESQVLRVGPSDHFPIVTRFSGLVPGPDAIPQGLLAVAAR